MREYHVTIYRCHQCGAVLELSCEKPKEIELVNTKITGADKVETELWIKPCRTCYRAAVEPLRSIKKALDDINKTGS